MGQSVHSSDRPFSCSMCNKSFKVKAYLVVHMYTHSEEKPFSCSICDKSFSDRSNFKRHGAVHSNNRPFFCSVCNKPFKLKKALRQHMNTHSEEKPFSCSSCGKQFKFVQSIYQHNKICCKKMYPAKKVKLHNPGNKENVKKKEVISQIRVHSTGRPFSSQTTKKALKRKIYLRERNDQQQNEDLTVKDDPAATKCQGDKEKERAFTCTICDKSFSTQYILKYHGAVHSNDRPFVCSTCNKSFKRKSHLSQHMMSHSEEKLFSCSNCKSIFRSKASIYKHREICKMRNQIKVKFETLAPTEERSIQKGVKMNKRGNKENRNKKEVIDQIRVDLAGKSFASQRCKKSLIRKFYLREQNDQHESEDLEVNGDNPVSTECRRNSEKAELAETREDEHYFDPSPGWKLWKSWDVWDSRFKVLETREDEYDFDPPPGWRQWKNWDTWDSWIKS